jgi:hypothetical protein
VTPEGPAPGTRRRIRWAAWRVTDDGRIQVSATLDPGDDGSEDLQRQLWEYSTLEEAESSLGAGFREVVERVLAAGRRQGRWRP